MIIFVRIYHNEFLTGLLTPVSCHKEQEKRFHTVKFIRILKADCRKNVVISDNLGKVSSEQKER